jgi:NAD(P)H-hydrate epimerase
LKQFFFLYRVGDTFIILRVNIIQKGEAFMKVLTVQEMKELESDLDSYGVSYDTMMQFAGRNLAIWIINKFQSNEQRIILGLIGSGKNGSDTLITLTELISRGWFCLAYCVKERPQEDHLLEVFVKSGGFVVGDINQLRGLIYQSPMILDGILGTGFHPPMEMELKNKLLMINQFISSINVTPVIIAVDCPSGVDCDSGEVSKEVMNAKYTACMGAVKVGLLKFPAFQFCGEFVQIDIGLPEGFAGIDRNRSNLIDDKYFNSNIKKRHLDAHKGSFGRCAILAGSEKYPGAAYLAGKAAYLSGAGLVGIFSSNELKIQLSGILPEAVWWEIDHEYIDKGFIQSITTFLIGPGLDHITDSFSRFSKLIKYLEEFDSFKNCQIIFDADGLRLLGKIDNWWRKFPSTTILTPHPGEMAELTGLSVSEIQSARWEIVRHFASKWNKIVLLKGAISVVANPDGEIGIIPVATSALSKAGTGDILSGLIAGLCAQGNEPYKASLMGAYIHARAGLMLENKYGQTYTITASEVLAAIPSVISALKIAGNQS